MKRKHILALIIAVCLVLAGCSNSSNSNKDGDKKNQVRLTVVKTKLQISAAASLTDVSKALEKEFKKTIKMQTLNLTTVVLVH